MTVQSYARVYPGFEAVYYDGSEETRVEIAEWFDSKSDYTVVSTFVDEDGSFILNTYREGGSFPLNTYRDRDVFFLINRNKWVVWSSQEQLFTTQSNEYFQKNFIPYDRDLVDE